MQHRRRIKTTRREQWGGAGYARAVTRVRILSGLRGRAKGILYPRRALLVARGFCRRPPPRGRQNQGLFSSSRIRTYLKYAFSGHFTRKFLGG